MIDGFGYPYPNGAIFGYNTANLGAAPLYFQTSLGADPNSNGGGIWQGGAAPAYGRDSTGANYIYLKTANGTYDGTSNWGDSFLKLLPTTLTVPSGRLLYSSRSGLPLESRRGTSGYRGALARSRRSRFRLGRGNAHTRYRSGKLAVSRSKRR